MAKKIALVFQDCPMCGARKGWGEAQLKIADKHGFEIVETPFFATGAKEWIWEAAKAGMTLPFYTDGKKFSKNLEDFVVKPRKTRRKIKKEGENVDI